MVGEVNNPTTNHLFHPSSYISECGAHIGRTSTDMPLMIIQQGPQFSSGRKSVWVYTSFLGLHKGKANMLNVSFGWDFPDDGIVKAI